MKKIQFLLIISFLILINTQMVIADWKGPIEIKTFEWGNKENQIGFENGDPEDLFPNIIYSGQDGNIILPDGVNKRAYILRPNGTLINCIGADKIKSKYDMMPFVIGGIGNQILFRLKDDYMLYDYSGNLIKSFIGITAINPFSVYIIEKRIFILSKNDQKYYEYNTEGQLLKTYDSKPLELGNIKEQNIGGGNYKTKIEYPDYKYEVIVSDAIEHYYRDIFGNLIAIEKRVEGLNENEIFAHKVYRFDRCTNDKLIFDIPKSEYEPLTAEERNAPASKPKLGIEYGEPIISPLGDLYCWARTKTEYKILKWTWQGPEDAPQSLQISAGVAGLKLNWQKPIKDVETVSGYQILRSSEVCGPFTEVTTVKKDKLVFEDRTIKPPWKYYYVVKAVRDKKYSSDSNKVYMQWK